MKYDITIIGAGILGTSIAYFLSQTTKSKVLVLDQAPKAGFHTSSRNTGKVHAPFLYDPEKKRIFAKSAHLGFEMWETYCKQKNLPFKKDGVLEVALDEPGITRLEKYMLWGEQNGLEKDDIVLLDGTDVKKLEPEVSCQKAIFCKRDASVDYGILTEYVMEDAKQNGATFLLNTRAGHISDRKDFLEIKTNRDTIKTGFLINAAGGMSIDIAHQMGVRTDLTDIYFRGEYWKAGPEYQSLTKTSVYSVPKHPEYPFLDPHWIVRSDGRCEVGPNAVPVFSPYGYTLSEDMKKMPSKVLEMLSSGAAKILFDSQFISLALGELLSSLSKTVMINQVREFLPKVDPKKFKKRGTAGIRASVIDKDGKFVPDVVIAQGEKSFHILNYNSPGATGALPFAVYTISQMKDRGLVKIEQDRCGQWSFEKISEMLGK
ncbi:NAD(P)/FAD-dependent oxidoreductase [Candidatus Nitrosotalea okcheonensis]|uniref:FAD dependent oxidoreductase n=1 Tax=Candidatus Nitrosotalea okcheonensis TaxID=1903276 RepID=A0A2H1FHG4_9ARCH|nr:FAD-dependent oxidoreductase [Candidatus Nitrosotalea okcheonensis]SMH72209.1 FAD dependent oxidoreductase [Candidatus Nitrosotalea okcheonensis]